MLTADSSIFLQPEADLLSPYLIIMQLQDMLYAPFIAAIHCPYEKKECKLKHEYLQENKVLRYECEVPY